LILLSNSSWAAFCTILEQRPRGGTKRYEGEEVLLLQGGTVGAAHTLSPARAESFACNLTASADVIAQQVVEILEDRQKCALVARNAAAASRAYDSTANAKQLMDMVEEHVAAAPDAM
jgi:hypothetical protein